MRPLRPGSLPTDTSLRFLLVLAAVTAASLYLFSAMWFLFRGWVFADAVARCADVSGELVAGQIGTGAEQLRAAAECRTGASREQAAAELIGSLVVLWVAYLVYRIWPRLVERRAHLTAPVQEEATALLAEVGRLSVEAGVEPVPALRLDATNPAVSGFAYGAGRRMRLGLAGGLVVTAVTDPPAFRAIVRHELGHVAERDVPWTYYAVAMWWSFLALAVLPVTLLFAVRDLGYLLRLGWRTVALAGLVALTIAALLRVRESYADARAAQWGSGADLDRLLASAPDGRTRRPEALRTHPTHTTRRAGLADPDLLFAASGWAAFAAGVAASAAQTSVADLVYLIAPGRAGGIAALLVAPLVAAVVCTSAWRVGLREAVRGCRPAGSGRLGVGLGVGLAVGPILSFDAAVGSFAQGASGWAGYLIWAVAQAGVAVLLAQWALDSARLRVRAALGEPAGPRAAFAWHVLAMTGVLALWLATSAQMLTVMTTLGVAGVGLLPVLHLVPQSALVTGAGAWPLVLVAGLLIQPVRSLQLAGRPPAQWFWRDPGEVTGSKGAGADPESGPLRWGILGTCAVIGAAAGVVGAVAGAATLVLGSGLDGVVQASDSFLLAVTGAISAGLTAASVCAGVGAAAAVPRGWWPIGLLASVVALWVAGAGAWLTLSAYRYGILGIGGTSNRPLGWAGTQSTILEPGLRALMATILAMAVVGLLRPARAPSTSPDGIGAPRARSALSTSAVLRTVLVGAGVMLAVLGWIGLPVLSALSVSAPSVSQPGYTVAVPPPWEATSDPESASAEFRTVAQDVLVVILPTEMTSPVDLGESIQVGDREAVLIDATEEGIVLWLTYEVRSADGPFLVVVGGTPDALLAGQQELRELFAGVTWVGGG